MTSVSNWQRPNFLKAIKKTDDKILMEKNKIINYQEDIIKEFKKSIEVSHHFCIWQKESNAKRIVGNFRLKEISARLFSLQFESNDSDSIMSEFKNLTSTNCYNFNSGYLFKTTIYNNQINEGSKKRIVEMNIPYRILFIDDKEKFSDSLSSIEDLRLKGHSAEATKEELLMQANLMNLGGAVLTDEEDVLFSSIRESPRGKLQAEKEALVIQKIENLFKQHKVKVVDISQGGMGIFTQKENDFSVGEELDIVSIGEKNVAGLRAIVRSIRPYQKKEMVYKIGLQFIQKHRDSK